MCVCVCVCRREKKKKKEKDRKSITIQCKIDSRDQECFKFLRKSKMQTKQSILIFQFLF